MERSHGTSRMGLRLITMAPTADARTEPTGTTLLITTTTTTTATTIIIMKLPRWRQCFPGRESFPVSCSLCGAG